MAASRVAGCSAVCCFAGGGRNVRSIVTLIVIFLAQPALGSQASVPGCFFCANDLCLLAFSFWRPAQRLCAFAASQRLLCICCIAAASVHLLHCSVFCASAASQRLLRSGKLFRSDFRFAPSLQQRPRPAISSRWLSAAAPPASNKPHLAEKISGLASNLAHLGRIC